MDPKVELETVLDDITQRAVSELLDLHQTGYISPSVAESALSSRLQITRA